MTAFFILSGFSLFMTWQYKDLHNISVIKSFYLKRLIGILPLYYTVAVLYIILLGKESSFQNVLIAPVEILGIQSVFNSLFSVTHNGGTWFISCILLCYAIYPLLQEITKQIYLKTKVIIIVIASFVLLYSPLIVHWFQTSNIYSNPFFRILEFFIGVLICSLIQNISNNKWNKKLYSWRAVTVEYAILIICVTVGVNFHIAVGNYMLYSWIALPMFVLLIVSSFGVKFSAFMKCSKVIIYLSQISYAFFLSQFFVWKTTLLIVNKIGIDTNVVRIFISLILCTVIAILLHEIVEIRFTKILKRKF